jgi:hypothetical protein
MSKTYILPGTRVTHISDPARDLPGTDPVVGTVRTKSLGKVTVSWPERAQHIEPWNSGYHNLWAVRVAKAPAR